jgi:hypothetical protein
MDPIILPHHFFGEIEDHEKNKSMSNATRTKREGTTWANMVVAWYKLSFDSLVQMSQTLSIIV